MPTYHNQSLQLVESPVDGVAVLGGLTLQEHHLSVYTYSPSPQSPTHKQS